MPRLQPIAPLALIVILTSCSEQATGSDDAGVTTDPGASETSSSSDTTTGEPEPEPEPDPDPEPEPEPDGDPCASPSTSGCVDGLACVDDLDVAGCTSMRCCTPFCDRDDPGACAQLGPSAECVPHFEDPPPAGYENLGHCAT